MQFSQPHYLPLTLPFFALLVGVLVFLLAMLQVGALRYAYMRIGLSGGWAMVVLLGSLVGSYFNIPVTELTERHISLRRRGKFLRDALCDPGRCRLARNSCSD
jgi:uncharacterized membrane protein